MIGNKILVFSPHPDDETIGCGATIAKYVDRGATVNCVWISSGERGSKKKYLEANLSAVREREAKAAASILGISKTYFLRSEDSFVDTDKKLILKISEIILEYGPDTILTSYPDKMNNDHIVTNEVVSRATMLAGGVSKSFLCYEVWTPIEDCNYFEDVSDYYDIKRKALAEYKSQLKLIKYNEAIEGLNRYRGLMGVGSRYAEAFKLIYGKG